MAWDPDARCRGFYDNVETVVISANAAPLSSSSSEEESNGTTTVCEAKLASIHTDSVLAQLVKTTVTSAFIEQTHHPHLNPMIPVILMNVRDARVCLYDSKNDILLISKVFTWFDDDDDVLCKLGITLLWAMLNHR